MKYRRIVVAQQRSSPRVYVRTGRVFGVRAASLTFENARFLGKLNAREFHTILGGISFFSLLCEAKRNKKKKVEGYGDINSSSCIALIRA